MSSDTGVPDQYALLAAIWILASNDESPLITYRGLRHRLNLPEDYDVQILVRCHAELFRLEMPTSRLEQWKSDMRLGKRMPSWIRNATPEDRKLLIEGLSSRDGFRSQFRSTADAERSNMAIIEWGLNHIERLRKMHTDTKEAAAKSWQMWLLFCTSILGLLATVFAAYIKK